MITEAILFEPNSFYVTQRIIPFEEKFVLGWPQDAHDALLQLYQKHKKEKGRVIETLFFVYARKKGHKIWGWIL